MTNTIEVVQATMDALEDSDIPSAVAMLRALLAQLQSQESTAPSVDADTLRRAPPAAREGVREQPVAHLRPITHPDWLEVCHQDETGAFPVFAHGVPVVRERLPEGGNNDGR
jgi:hypothetical protein